MKRLCRVPVPFGDTGHNKLGQKSLLNGTKKKERGSCHAKKGGVREQNLGAKERKVTEKKDQDGASFNAQSSARWRTALHGSLSLITIQER